MAKSKSKTPKVIKAKIPKTSKPKPKSKNKKPKKPKSTKKTVDPKKVAAIKKTVAKKPAAKKPQSGNGMKTTPLHIYVPDMFKYLEVRWDRKTCPKMSKLSGTASEKTMGYVKVTDKETGKTYARPKASFAYKMFGLGAKMGSNVHIKGDRRVKTRQVARYNGSRWIMEKTSKGTPRWVKSDTSKDTIWSSKDKHVHVM